MIRRLASAAAEDICNAFGELVTGLIFWAAKHADPTVINWANLTDDELNR